MEISTALSLLRQRGKNVRRALLGNELSAPSHGGRVIQLVASLNYGDAVGNEVAAIAESLRRSWCDTEIWTRWAHPALTALPVRIVSALPPLDRSDLLIYHFASECPFASAVPAANCRVLLRYHNVTPSRFFHGYDALTEKNTANALLQLPTLLQTVDGCLPASDFSAGDLRELGYAGPMEVLPVQLRWEDYAAAPDEDWLRRYSDGMLNILSVGRIAPNKRLEDVISSYAVFHRRHPRSRLILAGSFAPQDPYYLHLLRHAGALGTENVVFTGHIGLPQLIALYRTASLYLCMSEHEGFCVPLLEAMAFGVPIAAYAGSAVTETVGHGGLLFPRKDFPRIAEGLERLLEERTIWQQRELFRLRSFHYEQSDRLILEALHLGEPPGKTSFPFDSPYFIGYNGLSD